RDGLEVVSGWTGGIGLSRKECAVAVAEEYSHRLGAFVENSDVRPAIVIQVGDGERAKAWVPDTPAARERALCLECAVAVAQEHANTAVDIGIGDDQIRIAVAGY